MSEHQVTPPNGYRAMMPAKAHEAAVGARADAALREELGIPRTSLFGRA